ncbi:sn-glycerol-3-phosphate ABC transporter ATP-binding protein UgpC [Candidatus Calescamantes bacterium]|nr:sn-glycerol-3-phosphate ABC transporter ATP-binding protein UgpC [Candidatus Calescamantes bacterium]
MAEVILKNVKKVYPPDIVAVRDFNLNIKDKEFIVLVGPSGCGKSTTLRMIAGLEEITEGEIYIDKTLVNDIPPKDRDIAMVFQNYALYPHMTVYENMAFGLKLRKFPRDEIEKRVKEAAKILGIENLLNRYPKELSGGQKQRVAVGRAIVRKPKAFLFDEPLSNLDAKLRVQMRAELIKLHQRLGATMIYVTHDQVEAMTMGDRLVVMKDGVIQQVADPLTLYHKPRNKFVAGFIGSPPMNFIEGRIEATSGNFTFVKPTFKVALPSKIKDKITPYVGKEVILGIRPEDIEVGGNIECVIEVIETLGNEVFFHLRVGEDLITARFPSLEEGGRKMGEKMKIKFPPEKIHLFDKETELSILYA